MSPFRTALSFLLFVMAMDAGLVAPVFEGSYAMFASVLGTWIPFLLIFLGADVAGVVANRKQTGGHR